MKQFFLIILLLFSSCTVLPPGQTASETPELITDGVYRGPHINDYNKLVTLGIKTVISLEEEEDYLHFDGVQEEGSILFTYNIKFVHIAMSADFLRPPSAALLHMIATSMKQAEKPLYIHCTRGIDRTGYAIAAYRILVQGWSVDEAYKEVLSHGHSSDYFYMWKPTLDKL